MDTFVAISTPPGKGGIGIVRMNGDNSLNLINKIFKSKTSLSPRVMTYGYVYDKNRRIDEVMVCYFKAPRSYTREDMVEIYCHGGYITSLLIYELLIELGARPAEPGEFTKLAFLNGRINLLEAEAVHGIIEAQNREEQQLYMGVLGGVLTKKIDELSDGLVALVAECEAKIDYPELGDVEDMKERLSSIIRRIDELLLDEERTSYVREGIKTAIVGRPNVGKSSLLNALTNKERAIVTEIPGTTRDTIEEFISIDGVYLHLMDTAGIRDTEEVVEAYGIKRSLEAINSADLVLAMFDGSSPLDEDDRDILRLVMDKNAVIIVNKTDKERLLDEEELKSIIDKKPLYISVKNDEGIRELVEKIKRDIIEDVPSNSISLFKARHRNSLKCAKEALLNARNDMDFMPFEVVEVNLRDALDNINNILGRDSSEDIIDRVFKDFCVGK